MKIILSLFLLLSLPGLSLAQDHTPDEVDEQASGESSSEQLQLPTMIFLGVPLGNSSSPLNQAGYYFNFSPEFKLTDQWSFFGNFLAHQDFTFDQGLYFNESDVGIKRLGQEFHFGTAWTPEYSLFVLLPWDQSEVLEDNYRGGAAAEFKLIHDNDAKSMEFSLSATYTQLSYETHTTAAGLENVSSYLECDLGLAYLWTPTWTLGANINYDYRRFFSGQYHSMVGFDLFASHPLTESGGTALIMGIGNFPVPREPENLSQSLPVYDSELDFAYLGLSFGY